MASQCACRTSALRTFVRSLAQVHPATNDNLARAAPWHEARRQLHRARATTRWPAISGLLYRSLRTAATDSSAAAAAAAAAAVPSGENAQTGTADADADAAKSQAGIREQEVEKVPRVVTVVEETTVVQAAPPSLMSGVELLSQEVAAELAKGEATVTRLKFNTTGQEGSRETVTMELHAESQSEAAIAALEAPEDKPTKTKKTKVSEQASELEASGEKKSQAAKAKESKARAKFPPKEEAKREQQTTLVVHKEVVVENPALETVAVDDITAEQKASEEARERARAERRAAREKHLMEEREQEEIARRRREIARLQDPEGAKQLTRKQEQEELARRRREKERLQNRPLWQSQKEALKAKFPEGWRPRRRLSPDALDGIRALHQQFPDTYTTAVLANKFEVSPEAIRRILRSDWDVSLEEEEDRQRRWHNRGVTIWEHYAALGMKPPQKWRALGVGAERAREPAERDGGGAPQHGGPSDWYGEEMEPSPRSAEQKSRVKVRQKLSERL